MVTTLPSKPIPLYQQIEATLRARIETGELRPGDRLPSVSELRRLFGGVNHLTVRHALKRLTDDGLVRAEQGRGTFVQTFATRGRVALVVPHLVDSSYLPFIHGVRAVLLEAGIKVVILDSRGSRREEADHLENLTEIPVNGAIIFPVHSGRLIEHVCRFQALRFPYVIVDSVPRQPLEALGEESARLLVQLLRSTHTVRTTAGRPPLPPLPRAA